MPERRRDFRLPLPEGSVSGFRGTGKILDISPTGMRVEVSTRCVFARGELHRLVLSDLLETVEVEGSVRWTQSSWRDPRHSQGGDYVQTAGFAFSRLLSDQPAGIWSSILGHKSQPETPKVAKAADPISTPIPTPTPKAVAKQTLRLESPLSMVEPVDGATVDQSSVKIICTIDKPETLTGFRINGVEAIVERDLGVADIELQKGTNRIISTVARRNGTYSTYLLGKVTRAKVH